MPKAILFVGKSPLQERLINVLKQLAADIVDEGMINVTSELPEKFLPYKQRGYWLKPIGNYCLILSNSFFKPSNRRFFNKAFKAYNGFLKPIIPIQLRINEEMKKDVNRDAIRPLTYFSVIAEASRKLTLVFLITNPLSELDFQKQLDGVKNRLQDFLKNIRTYRNQTLHLHKIDGKTVFLLWNHIESKWEFVNLLFLVGQEKMLKFGKGDDSRYAKPDMIVNEINLDKEITLESNWRIEGGTRSYIMNRPNDIAIYRNIANKTLERAREKFEKIHRQHLTELILPKKIVSEFFDYFEEIIQSAIMSYTTIECMANSCIPYNHKHIKVNRGVTTIYNKESIELNFTLREKLKEVFPAMLKSGSPVTEKWWQMFIELEALRNEIIHTKKANAETRYSMLVKDRIFEVAAIHNIIVSHYGNLFRNVKSHIMNEFPIGVGCDELIPGLMTDRDFTKHGKM